MGLVVLLSLGCAPTLPRPYLEAKAAGHRAYGSGRYDEAAGYFREAAGKAERIKDRDEVLYLEAAAYQRAGRHREARGSYEALLALSPSGARAARAAHEIARLEVRHGDPVKGWAMTHDVVKRFPKSGVARPALLRYLAHLDETQGVPVTIRYLEKSHPWFDAQGMGEVAAYQRALRLEQQGQFEQARDAFLECAGRYPYPSGGLFDDALLRASLIEEKLGRPKEAIGHLRKMLSVREPSTMHGSYERPRFSAAQMRIGELYRDAVGDPDMARKEFRKLFDSFKTSMLRDDALWAEARVAADQGDRSGACQAVNLLVKELPESRYAACGKLLCETAREPAKARPCRDYVAREVEKAP
jgi:tetratricopeptide (TPR) repeat protein